MNCINVRFCTIRAFLFILLIFASNYVYSADWLFKNGNSEYQIVVSEDASISEKTAARELHEYLQKISGVSLPLSSMPDNNYKHVFVGYSIKVAAFTGQMQPKADDESFTYCSFGHDLYIWGGKQRGTMYGVFSFLEKELGVHWLTPDCTIVPRRKKWKLRTLYHSEKPAIKYRYNYYYVTRDHLDWSAHNKENMRGPAVNEYGNQEGYWSCHTMGRLIKVKEYYQSHPEYFSLRDGKRMSENEQLCLSNPEVLELCKKKILKAMRDNPEYRFYSLSQNDNQNFCQCENCARIEKKYGGHSGIILWFVNQVADAIRDEFPDKYVGTFAYQYSRKPPVGIVPHDNVVIRLCSIECCFAHPITSQCPQNLAFIKDLQGWSSIAPHLFIWDYIVDFSQYIAPWPNFQVLAPNIRTFRDNNAIGVFEEAAYQSLGGEFEEMKSWVVNKLLWNPDQSTDSLVKVFIKGYYGNAASQVMSYYLLCKSLVNNKTHFGIFIRENHDIYTERFVKKALYILGDALRIAEDEDICNRVEKVYMQPLYLYCMRNKEESRENGLREELFRLMRKYNARPSEDYTLEFYLSHN